MHSINLSPGKLVNGDDVKNLKKYISEKRERNLGTRKNRHQKLTQQTIQKIDIKDFFLNNKLMTNFNVLDVLGHGAFGTVFKAEQKLEQNIYAIKVITLMKNEVNDFVNSNHFREVLVMSRLNHRNIINYLTCWFEEGNCFNINSLLKNCKAENDNFTSDQNSQDEDDSSIIFDMMNSATTNKELVIESDILKLKNQVKPFAKINSFNVENKSWSKPILGNNIRQVEKFEEFVDNFDRNSSDFNSIKDSDQENSDYDYNNNSVSNPNSSPQNKYNFFSSIPTTAKNTKIPDNSLKLNNTSSNGQNNPKTQFQSESTPKGILKKVSKFGEKSITFKKISKGKSSSDWKTSEKNETQDEGIMLYFDNFDNKKHPNEKTPEIIPNEDSLSEISNLADLSGYNPEKRNFFSIVSQSSKQSSIKSEETSDTIEITTEESLNRISEEDQDNSDESNEQQNVRKLSQSTNQINDDDSKNELDLKLVSSKSYNRYDSQSVLNKKPAASAINLERKSPDLSDSISPNFSK